MRYRVLWLVALLPLAALPPIACSGSGDEGGGGTRLERQERAASGNGYRDVLGESGGGFLAENPTTKKRLLYVEGTHREMGFQTGYLCPAAVKVMVHDYTNEVLFEMLELPFGSEQLGPIWDTIRSFLKRAVVASEPALPLALREEMQGVAEGYAQALAEGKAPGLPPVEYADVLLLNQAMDVVSALTYATLGKVNLGCNQFACWGSRTHDGRLLHGRDFQFYTAGVYQDASLLAVYYPRAADGSPSGHPFASVTAPGFVGQATAINSEGVSMGIDVVHSWGAQTEKIGLGGLLVVRSVIENAGSLEEAIRIARQTDRGCPWIYLVADGKARSAAVLETIQSEPPAPWMEERLVSAEEIGAQLIGEPFSTAFPDRGVAVRSADFVLPETYRGKAMTLPGYHNNAHFPENHTVLNYSFADPIETADDIVAATNHFLLPEMRPFQWAPMVSLVWMTYWPSTEWRYQTLVGQLLEKTASGGTLDWEGAWRTIDFLDPTTEEGAFYNGPDVNQVVGGHVALMDGKDLVLRSLYGYYKDPWAEVRLRDFLN